MHFIREYIVFSFRENVIETSREESGKHVREDIHQIEVPHHFRETSGPTV